MPDDTQNTGSAEHAEPAKGPAFPPPPVEGVDSGEKNRDNTAVMVNPRDAFLADMDSKIDAQREAEIAQNQIELAEASGFTPPEELEEGLQNREQMHPEQIEEEGLPAELANDPLADYIVMDGDTPMFRTKVDGEEKFIPLDVAKTQLQKSVAAEVRLQQAAAERKQLDEREAQIRINEATLQERMNLTVTSPPPDQDVSDQGQEDEVRGVVESLFTGTEDQAVEKLTHLLQSRNPAVNTGEIANQAVAAARKQLDAENAVKVEEIRRQDINSGYKMFGADYPEIVKDPNLFAYADAMTDGISADNPTWGPSEVMAEAGRKTTEWVESLRGPSRPLADPAGDRRSNKRNLKPMPRPGSGAAQVGESSEPVETPQSMMAEIRKQRGQA